MLAQEVLVLDVLGRRRGVTLDLTGVDRHLADLLQHDRMIHGLGGILAPGEGAMGGADDTRGVQGLDLAPGQLLDDDLAGVLLVVLVDFLSSEMTGAGHSAVEVVRMGGAVAGDVLAGLGPADRIGAVGVDDAADFGVLLVQLDVGLGVGRRIQLAVHHIALQVEDNHHIRGQILIIHAGGLDDDEALFPVDTGHITPGIGDKVALGQFHIGLIHGLLELFQHGDHPPFARGLRRPGRCPGPAKGLRPFRNPFRDLGCVLIWVARACGCGSGG